MDCIYFKDINEVIGIDQKTIEVSGGGADGIINLNSLDCALEQIQNDMYYPDLKINWHIFFG